MRRYMKEKYDAVKESEKFQKATEKAGVAVGAVAAKNSFPFSFFSSSLLFFHLLSFLPFLRSALSSVHSGT